MPFSRQVTIRHKLRRLSLVSAAIPLLIASLAFSVYEVFSYRTALTREMSLITGMVETSSAAALTFEDSAQGELALKAMQNNPDILSAFLYTESGHLLAGYRNRQAPEISPLPAPGPDRMEFPKGRVLMVRPLSFQGHRVGTLLINADMSGLRRQLLWTGLTISLIALLSFGLAITVFRRLEHALENPMVELAEAARAVTRDHDYGRRVRPHDIDELGLLMADFNEMMAEIQHRDHELKEYQERLEDMVKARTEQLEKDMEEKRSLEKQLFRAQRLESLGTLAGGVAHDLNNVLSPILLSVETLRQICPDPRGQKMLSLLEGATQRGKGIVKQILTFARGTDGERSVIDLRHTVRETLSIIEQTFPKAISVSCDLPHEVWPILGDSTQVHQLLLNLCVNARDAMSGGGTISVRVQNQVLDESFVRMHMDAKVGRYVLLSVEDTGHGMSPETLERIFEPFFTTKEVGKGTGLGLSTGHAIARGHGGFVTCYSEVGRGTTFNLFLPASEGATPEVAAIHGGALAQGKGELVLVVDDEGFNREVARQTLESFGYRVLTAEDGDQALDQYLAHSGEIGVVITDLMMPNLDGTMTIQALRMINPEARIIACSGLNRQPNPLGDPALEPNAFLQKPFSAQSLLKTLQNVMAG